LIDAHWPLIAAIAVLAVISAGLTVACLGQLDHIYSWDQLKYHDKAVRIAGQFQHSIPGTLASVAKSVRHDNHNDLAAVPLAVWVSVFGGDRQSFVLAILIVFALPTSVLFTVMMNVVVNRWRGNPASSWLVATWLFVPWFIGAYWAPTVVGRVGVGGLGLMFAAVALHLKRPLENQRWWQPIAVGGLLASAILFRRWYFFAVLGVLAAVAAQSLLAARRADRPVTVVAIFGKSVLLGVTSLGTVVILATPVFVRILRNVRVDFFDFFHHSGSVGYLWGNPWSMAERLGWPSLLVVLAALVIAWSEKEVRGFLAAALVTGAVALVLFGRVQAPGIHHVLVWIGVESVVLAVALASLWPIRHRIARVATVVSVLVLCTSVASVLFLRRGVGWESEPPWWNSLAPSLTVGDFLPANQDLVLATAEFIEAEIPVGSSVVLLATGLSLNDDTLRRIRFSLPERDMGSRFEFVKTKLGGPYGSIPTFIFDGEYVLAVDPVASPPHRRYEVLRVTTELIIRRSSPVSRFFDVVVGPTVLPDQRTIQAVRIRDGAQKRARRVLRNQLRRRLPHFPGVLDPRRERGPSPTHPDGRR
jgi:hypothetical protein